MTTNSARLLLCLCIPIACGDDGVSGEGETDTDGSSSGTTTLATSSTSASTTSPSTSSTATMSTGDPSTTSDDSTTTSGDESSSSTGEPMLPPTIPEIVKGLVADENGGTDVRGFPLEYEPGATELRTVPQLQWSLTAAFFDSLTDDASPTAPLWGANNDFIAYLGDGWEDDRGVPYYSGSGEAGWMWTNFEFISNTRASSGAAPDGQGSQMVSWLRDAGVAEFQFDVADDAQWTGERVESYILWHKRMLGGALFRVVWGEDGWAVDTSADNVRFDATSDTLFRVTGGIDVGIAEDDSGAPLPAGVVPGTSSNCSGGVTPWGTIITAEENTNFAYGDTEDCWSSSNAFVPGGSCDPGGTITWNTTPSASGDFTRGAMQNNRPELYSYLVEIDPESPPNQPYDAATGDGHQKLGDFGRAHWENATFAVGDDFTLVPDQPLVVYSGDDRRGGRIYKWVSNENYTDGMSKAEIRNLLADGRVYAAHFVDLDNSDDADTGALGGITVGGSLPTASSPGSGVWIRLDVGNDDDVAPNAGGSTTTVGEALGDQNWNGMGAFGDNETVLLGLYSAANKIGIRELNRPEDLEWRPLDGTLWVAFTNHGRPNALRDDGLLNVDDPGTPEDERLLSARADTVGSIFVITEENPGDPAASLTFTFRAAWHGSADATTFAAQSPDNLVIDSEGGVWFGTDGNYSTEKQDAIYYLDVADDPAESVAWRVAAVPSDAEATGPWLSSDERTLFFDVQHPHEAPDAAPSEFAVLGEYGSRSGQVALTLVEE